MKIIPNIGLNEVQREALAEILKTLLSDEFVLSTKTRKHFWNVTGPPASRTSAPFSRLSLALLFE